MGRRLAHRGGRMDRTEVSEMIIRQTRLLRLFLSKFDTISLLMKERKPVSHGIFLDSIKSKK